MGGGDGVSKGDDEVLAMLQGRATASPAGHFFFYFQSING